MEFHKEPQPIETDATDSVGEAYQNLHEVVPMITLYGSTQPITKVGRQFKKPLPKNKKLRDIFRNSLRYSANKEQVKEITESIDQDIINGLNEQLRKMEFSNKRLPGKKRFK